MDSRSFQKVWQTNTVSGLVREIFSNLHFHILTLIILLLMFQEPLSILSFFSSIFIFLISFYFNFSFLFCKFSTEKILTHSYSASIYHLLTSSSTNHCITYITYFQLCYCCEKFLISKLLMPLTLKFKCSSTPSTSIWSIIHMPFISLNDLQSTCILEFCIKCNSISS